MPESSFMPLEFLRPLWLLGVLAIFILASVRYKMAKNGPSQNLIAAHLSGHLVSSPSTAKKGQFTFNLLAVIACIALAGPSWRNLQLPVYEMERAQVIALDLSYSMYATDITPNRLSQAKYKAIDLLKQWGEGEKALIAYAGDAFTISPLTTDGNAIINHIAQLSPEIMPVTGARADLALERAVALLENAGYTQGHIVFITDDIDKQTAQKMVDRLKGSDWVVSILAMATEQGEPIRLPDGSLLKNQQGEIVVPKLQAQPLLAISNASHGLYLTPSSSNRDIERLATVFTVNHAHKKEGQSGQRQFAIDDGYWLAFLLLPLFLLLFRKGLFYALLLSITLPFTSPNVEASIWKNTQQNAFQAYQDKDYQSAAQLYEEPLAKGSALYQNKQYQQALDEFTAATVDNPTSANAFYNQGNAYAQLQKFDKAIAAYQQALIIDPQFKVAQENKQLLETLEKQQEQQQSEQQQSDQQQSEQQQSEQQQSDQQQSEQQQSDQQQSDQQQSDQQQSEQQQSDQQQSDQQQSDQQQSEQQQSDQQQSDQQQSEQQQSEQQQSDQQQKSEQQKAQQQLAEQQKAQQQAQSEQQLAEMKEAEQVNQELEELPNWLKNMPDDPALLLRNKMRLEYQKRAQSQPARQQNNGDIW